MKENKPLMYYNYNDLAKATIRKMTGKSAKPFAFEVIPEAVDGCEFEPGIFASSSAEKLEQVLREFNISRDANPAQSQMPFVDDALAQAQSNAKIQSGNR